MFYYTMVESLEITLAEKYGWPFVFQLEEFLQMIGAGIVGAAIAVYIIACLSVRVKKAQMQYKSALQDSDFTALRVIEKDGKAVILLNADTALEMVDAIISYFWLMFFPKRFVIYRSRRRANRITWVLWGVGLVISFLILTLMFHVNLNYPGYSPGK